LAKLFNDLLAKTLLYLAYAYNNSSSNTCDVYSSVLFDGNVWKLTRSIS
jgi:hypothetical protein